MRHEPLSPAHQKIYANSTNAIGSSGQREDWKKSKSLSAMEIGYHVLMLRGTNLAQQDSIPEMRNKRFVRKRASRSKGGKYGNLSRVRQISLAMPEPATSGEKLEGGFGGVRTGNRRTKGAGRSCVGPVPGRPFAAPALGIKAHGGV